MALFTAIPFPLQDMYGNMDTYEYCRDEFEMNSLLISHLKIRLYLTHLLNID